VKIRVDVSKLREAIRARLVASPNARTAAAQVIAEDLVRNLVELTPRDTNRLARAWILAGRGVGVTRYTVPKVIPSKHREKLVDVLADQANQAGERFFALRNQRREWYPNGPPKKGKGYYNRLVAREKKAEDHYWKCVDELNKLTDNPTAIVMMRGSGAALMGFQKNINAEHFKASIREKVYGGYGRVIDLPGKGQTMVVLINMEPHARVVEKRRGILRRAQSLARALGARRASRKYLEKLGT
jgi:hypothetical protein